MRMFKTESIEDLPIDQYRLLIALLNKENSELSKNSYNYETPNGSGGSKNTTTYRIINED